jgi:RimJ/RimL family protein N-acetyltransferase
VSEAGYTGDSRGAGDAAPIRLRPLELSDDLLLRRWIATPDVQRWWGSAASAEAEMRLARADPAAITRMIVAGGETVGYAQALDASLLGDRPPSAPAGAWDCDLFIGSPAHRGLGLGGRALDLLVAEVFRSSLALACMLLVSVRNERAARACEAIGFRWSAIHDDAQLGPCWVMLRDRPRG